VKAQAGGVRRLTISWELTDVIPSSPANQYDVKVKDGRGITTGELSGAINYTHLVDEECHVDVWQGALAD
jgi:hypothetical protein